MTAYRIARRPYADLSGAGGKFAEGRCNPKGVATVYCSENISLCALEILVHIQQHQVPDDCVLMTINIPTRVLTLDGAPGRLKEESGLRERRPAWAVRSVIIPRERNIVLFPEHREFRASIVSVEHFSFDPRLIDRATIQ